MNQPRTSRVPAERTHRSGFTLLEMVIVVLIIGILTAAAAPRYLEAMTNYRADATARRIVVDLQLAKRRAQQTSTSQTIAFYVADNRYEISAMNDLDRSSQVYENRLGGGVYQATLVSANFGGSSTLTFDIYGQPSSAGTIVFNTGGSNLTILIGATGRINAPTRADIAALGAGT